jgi:hypothetical protein
MSLDGLRAWIGEVERKLGMRTRVFLVLTAIAIGGAGAGIYLALEASDEATGEADVSALEERIDQLESQATGEPEIAPLELQLEELRKQVEQLEGKGAASGSGGAGTSGGGAGGVSATGGASEAEPAPEEALPSTKAK